MGERADILVIDDDPRLCATIGDVLQHRGHRVRTAYKGHEALERLVQQPVDLAIVDFKLPDVSGLDLLESIKATSPETAVILISGQASLSSALEAINGEASSYLVKPLDIEQLVGTVDRALAKQCLVRALRESEERCRLVTENLTEAVFLLDLQGRLLMSNTAAAVLTGYRRDELVGRPVVSLLTPESARQAIARLGAVRAGRDVSPQFEARLIRKDGSRVWLEVTLSSVVKDGHAVGRLGVARELTAPRRAGAPSALVDHAAIAIENEPPNQDQCRGLETLKASQARLVETERLEAVGALTSSITHYVNNVLQAVLGRVQLVLQKPEQPETVQDLEISERTILDAGRVLRKLRRFSEVRALSNAEPTDLNGLVRQAVQVSRTDWEGDAPADDGRLHVTTELGDIPRVAGEPMALLEVLAILLANAVEALPAGGDITIRTWASEGAVHCAVGDSGVGMSEDVRRRAVEPFFTTKGPDRRGLGLSVAHGIVRRHHGEIEITNVEGGGTLVAFHLPLSVRVP